MIDSFVMLFQQIHVEYFLVVDGMLGYVIELMESTGCRLARMQGPGSCTRGRRLCKDCRLPSSGGVELRHPVHRLHRLHRAKSRKSRQNRESRIFLVNWRHRAASVWSEPCGFWTTQQSSCNWKVFPGLNWDRILLFAGCFHNHSPNKS